MSALFAASGRSSRTLSHPVLAGLMSSVGASGLSAAARHPGLLAAIDQHAAAVRDSLLEGSRGRTGPTSIRPAVLAAYVEGVRDAAVEHGWRPPAGPIDWTDPDWVLLRLLAGCALAHDLGPRPRR